MRTFAYTRGLSVPATLLVLFVSSSLRGQQYEVSEDAHLSLRYTFAGVTGNTVPDASGLGHHGVLEGKAGELPQVVGTRYGPALRLLKGCGQGIRIPWSPDLAGRKGLTVMAWIKPTEVRRHLAIVAGKGDRVKGQPPSGYRLSVFWSRALMDIGLEAGTEERLSSPEWSVSADAWAHVTMAYDGNRMCVYINATIAAEQAIAEPSAVIPFQRDITIGKYFWNDAYPFTGLIADVQIYNQALTEEDVYRNASRFLHTKAAVHKREK